MKNKSTVLLCFNDDELDKFEPFFIEIASIARPFVECQVQSAALTMRRAEGRG